MLKEIIVITPLYVSLFWAVVFFTASFSANKARYWLGVFMLVVSVLYGCHAAYFLGFQQLYLKLDSLYLLAGLSVYPMYYLYIRLLTCDLKLKWSYFRHFIPAFVIFAALFLSGRMASPEEQRVYFETVLVKNEFPGGEAPALVKTMAVIFFLSRLVFGLQTLVYLVLGYQLAKRYNQRIANFYSNMEGRELVWVNLLTTSLLATSVLSFIVNLLGRGFFMEKLWLMAIPSLLFSSLFFIIGLQGNRQNFNIKSLDDDEKKNCQDVKNNAEQRNEKLKHNLLNLLEKKKIYLEPELKITDLCPKLNTNRTYLSNLINTEFNLSFNDLINKYRIEHAISIIKNDTENQTSIQEIATASGFGSLSSFNRAFQKNTGVAVGRFKNENSSPGA
jgi:AraC-like DNA-binding protein